MLFVSFCPSSPATYAASNLIYVNALPCETLMLQIVTLCRDYLYEIADLCIINSTEGATCFNNSVVLNILR